MRSIIYIMIMTMTLTFFGLRWISADTFVIISLIGLMWAVSEKERKQEDV